MEIPTAGAFLIAMRQRGGQFPGLGTDIHGPTGKVFCKDIVPQVVHTVVSLVYAWGLHVQRSRRLPDRGRELPRPTCSLESHLCTSITACQPVWHIPICLKIALLLLSYYLLHAYCTHRQLLQLAVVLP